MTDRIACAVVPALPLQMLLRRRGPQGIVEGSRGIVGLPLGSPTLGPLGSPTMGHGDDAPVAVVDRDSPTGRVLWASPAAIRGGVLPGLRYAAALALCRDLRAGTVPAPEIRAEVTRLAALLRRHSPRVEPSGEEPGVFWLGVRGLVPLYASLAAWREETLAALRAEKYVARAAVGFTRFGSFTAARAGREPGVFEDPAAEREAALGAPLRLLGLPPDDRDALERLGVFRVRDLLALPAAGVGSRFGPETARLRRLAAGDLPDPLEPVRGEEPIRAREILEHAETDAARLLLLLDRLLAPLAERDRAAAAVAVRLALDDGGTALLEVRPAAPTRDAAHLSQLLRLRLEATRLASGVVEAAIEIRAAPADPGERRLFADRAGRDADAAGRALARVRAEFGPGAAARARLRDAHLPEASFEWAPLEGALPPPCPRALPRHPLVRRLLLRPLPIASPESARHADGGWSPGGLRAGAAVPGAGPFAVSGGWWAREVRREYHWLETRRGDVLWAFHDRVRRRWFLQGRVE